MSNEIEGYKADLVNDPETVARIVAALPAVPTAAAAVVKTDAASIDLAVARAIRLAGMGLETRIELNNEQQ